MTQAASKNIDTDFVPALARGEDRRKTPRADTIDWRVDPRSHEFIGGVFDPLTPCLLYTSPSPRDQRGSRMPSSA